jgi:hypothetical protein
MKKGALLAGYLLPRLRDIFFLAVAFAVILLGPRLLNADGDLGRHLTIGNFILDNITIPTRDIFSHTMTGAPLVPHEWLAEVLYALADRAMGLNGVVILSALLIAGAFTLVYTETLRRSQMPLLAFGLAFWGAAASSLHWISRPHLFTLLFLAFWTSRLLRVTRAESTPLWQFPLIMMLWANLHGAFIAGFVVWGAILAGHLWEQRKFTPVTRHLLLIGGAALLATLVNPSGWHLWQTSLGYLQNRYLVGHTQEYFSPDFHQPGTWPFLGLLALAVFALSRGWKRLSAADSLLLTGWAALGLVSARNIPLFAVVAPQILAEAIRAGLENFTFWQQVENRLKNIEQNLRGFLWPLIAILLIALMVSAPAMTARNTFDPAVFPVQAVDWLEAHPQPGNMFNYFTWGGYLLHRQWPEQKVFIDGQTDFYGEALTRQYEQIITLAEGWENVLDQYAVTWAIIPTDSALSKALIAAGWQSIYQDATASIFIRK